MWIAVAVAVGVFLLLLLIAQFTNKGNKDTAPASSDAETVEEVGDAAGNAESAADTDAESGTETEADSSTDTDTDADSSTDANTDTDADSDTDTDKSTETDADSGKTDNATATTDDTTTTTDSAATTTDSAATTTDSSATTTTDATAATSDSGNSEPSAAATTDNAATTTNADATAAVQYADIMVQDYGKITVELDASAAPLTVQNFVDLAESGFYNGLTFHRIMDGFMAQGGDPLGNGTGGADKNIVGEFSSNGYTNNLSHTRGTISMARASGDKNSASSQFFIVQSDSTFLDGDYAAFGHVTEGMEVVDQMCKDAKPTDNNGSIAPDEQPIIESITIRDK
ncbi:MAG: peptidylprolyl isomerase [Oscillospiraceae bacterium]|nr:peptidylprolyl isomerase [Oscillospiraceae bacterium]